MAITEAFAVTETVTTTEWSLTTDTAGPDVQTDDGVYQVFLDLNALVKGDKFTFRVYEKVLAASTQRVVYEAFFSHAQSDAIWVSPTLILLHGWDMTLIKTAGTDRAIDASIRKVA
jgi:hypothetical protein